MDSLSMRCLPSTFHDEEAARLGKTVDVARPAAAGIGGNVEVAFSISERGCRPGGSDATGVNDASCPSGQAAVDGGQRTVVIEPSSVDRRVFCEVVERRGHQHVVARNRHCGAVRACWPACSTFHVTHHRDCRRARLRCGHHHACTVRVRSDLMDVAVDGNGRVPCPSAVGRPGHATGVDVGEKHRPVAGRGDRPDPHRRSDALPIE
jgi:hypothetical protein